MQVSVSPAASGYGGICTAAPSHPQNATIAAAANAKSAVAMPMKFGPACPGASLIVPAGRCQAHLASRYQRPVVRPPLAPPTHLPLVASSFHLGDTTRACFNQDTGAAAPVAAM